MNYGEHAVLLIMRRISLSFIP